MFIYTGKHQETDQKNTLFKIKAWKPNLAERLSRDRLYLKSEATLMWESNPRARRTTLR